MSVSSSDSQLSSYGEQDAELDVNDFYIDTKFMEEGSQAVRYRKKDKSFLYVVRFFPELSLNVFSILSGKWT